jgi:hypothetical protein
VVEENRQVDGNIPAALATKVQTFASTLAPDEAAQLQWLAQQVLVQEQQGYASSVAASSDASPTSSRPIEQLKQELPESLVDKLREFTGTLSADEWSELQQAGQAPGDEVQGYGLVEYALIITLVSIVVIAAPLGPSAHPFPTRSYPPARL